MLIYMLAHTACDTDEVTRAMYVCVRRYAKPDVAANKPLATRVDLKMFFDQYGVKAFSTFKKKFCTEPLSPIGPGGAPMPTKKKVHTTYLRPASDI